jgi:hypothetical protein
MENTPFIPSTPESGDDKDPKAASKKKKSAEVIGAFIVEPKSEKTESEKPKGLFEQLTGMKEEKKSDPTTPEETANEEVRDEAEQAPLESLSDEERQYVEAELVGAVRAETAPITDHPEEIAAEAAVESFRNKIVVEGQDSEAAFTETLNELDVETETNVESEIEAVPLRPEVMEPSEEAIIDLRHEEDTPEPVVFGGAPTVRPQPVVPNAERPVIVENNDFGMFLVGGIVGYLIGRRRGRIKTEKRLMPIQNRLEKQVTNLKVELERKEAVIRQVAVERVRYPERALKARVETKVEVRERIAKPLPPERIGKVIIEGGSARAEAVRRVSPVEGLTEKDIVTLNRVELLAVSEKIIVEGTSLRHIYETHLVGEKGLRRLVAEFLRGGNLNKALKRELVEKEIDFERDPILRDKNRSDSNDGGGKHLEALLKKVDNLPGGDTGEMAVLKARAAHEAIVQNRKQQRRKLADLSLAAIIAILIASIITLLLTR